MEKLHTNSGDYQLERLPQIKNDTLRAWDAADELLIHTVFTDYAHLFITPPLIANDSFGALAIAFNKHPSHSWSDSFISHLATTHNFSLNQLSSQVKLIPATAALDHCYDLVLIKIPKTLSLLEDQLCRLKPHIHAKTIIIGAGMSKHIHTSTLKLFEKIIGTTSTSRATKKARLIYANNDQQTVLDSPFPKTIQDASLGIRFQNLANVFANDRLDIGSRFFLETIKKHLNQNQKNTTQVTNIIDLGCGNGLVGIIAKQLLPDAKINFTDESYAAIASAKLNYTNETTDKNSDDATFIVSNSLDQYEGDTPDLILCNPPFHQFYAIGDHIAWSMFQQSYQTLSQQGELWVVGNRHLAYHIKLKKLFGNCKTIASNKKFVVLVATKH